MPLAKGPRMASGVRRSRTPGRRDAKNPIASTPPLSSVPSVSRCSRNVSTAGISLAEHMFDSCLRYGVSRSAAR